MASTNHETAPAALHQHPRRFRREELVEVASMEEGFEGSYYEAAVVSDIGELGYIVRFSTLLADDKSSELLREVAKAEEVRPRPPPVEAAEYKVGEEVDAFDNDGWWWGRIIGRGSDGNYKVFFHTTGEEMSYPENMLRIHQEFVNGIWTRWSDIDS